jgi:hypothetical protein
MASILKLTLLSISFVAAFDANSSGNTLVTLTDTNLRTPPTEALMITGHCDILKDGTRLPCVGIMVQELNTAGDILMQKRVSEVGDFSFPAKPGQNYLLAIKNDQYHVSFHPAPPFRENTGVLMELTSKLKK